MPLSVYHPVSCVVERSSIRRTKVGFEDINERLYGTTPSYIDHTRRFRHYFEPQALRLKLYIFPISPRPCS